MADYKALFDKALGDFTDIVRKAREQAEDGGKDTAKAFVDNFSDGMSEAPKVVKKTATELNKELNAMSSKIRRNQSGISWDDSKGLLNIIQQLISIDKYASKINETFGNMKATFRDIGEVSGLQDVLVQVKETPDALKDVDWGFGVQSLIKEQRTIISQLKEIGQLKTIQANGMGIPKINILDGTFSKDDLSTRISLLEKLKQNFDQIVQISGKKTYLFDESIYNGDNFYKVLERTLKESKQQLAEMDQVKSRAQEIQEEVQKIKEEAAEIEFSVKNIDKFKELKERIQDLREELRGLQDDSKEEIEKFVNTTYIAARNTLNKLNAQRPKESRNQDMQAYRNSALTSEDIETIKANQSIYQNKLKDMLDHRDINEEQYQNMLNETNEKIQQRITLLEEARRQQQNNYEELDDDYIDYDYLFDDNNDPLEHKRERLDEIKDLIVEIGKNAGALELIPENEEKLRNFVKNLADLKEELTSMSGVEGSDVSSEAEAWIDSLNAHVTIINSLADTAKDNVQNQLEDAASAKERYVKALKEQKSIESKGQLPFDDSARLQEITQILNEIQNRPDFESIKPEIDAEIAALEDEAKAAEDVNQELDKKKKKKKENKEEEKPQKRKPKKTTIEGQIEMEGTTEKSTGALKNEADGFKKVKDAADKATESKNKFTEANKRAAKSAKDMAEAGALAGTGINNEGDAAEQVSKAALKVAASQEEIERKYKETMGGGQINSNLADTFNAVLAASKIDVAKIEAAFSTKTKLVDGQDILGNAEKQRVEYDVIKFIAQGTDELGKATTVTREYEVATGDLLNQMGKFKTEKDSFDLSTALETAKSKVTELETRMGKFKFDIEDVKKSMNFTDEAELQVFDTALEAANQKLKELKATLKSTHSLDPIVNAESMMSTLSTTIQKNQLDIKKFADVEAFEALNASLATITNKIEEYNTVADGMSKAKVVQSINQEMAKYNANLDLAKAQLAQSDATEKLNADINNQISAIIKQQEQWRKTGQLTEEVQQKIDGMSYSLLKVTSGAGLAIWKKDWSTFKNEVSAVKYEIEAAAKAQKAAQKPEDESREYWDKERQRVLGEMITPEKRPELEQIKQYMLQEAEEVKQAVLDEYDVIMQIVEGKANALQHLMTAKGPNEKQYWQDQYSAWFGAANAMGINSNSSLSNFFGDINAEAIIGAEGVAKFTAAIERLNLLGAKQKDLQISELNSLYEKQAASIAKQMKLQAQLDSNKIGDSRKLAIIDILDAEEKSEAEIIKQIASYGELQDRAKQTAMIENARAKAQREINETNGKDDDTYYAQLNRGVDRQFTLMQKQQAQWEKSGLLTDELKAKISSMFDELANVTNSSQLNDWKTKWANLKDEVLATKYAMEATSKVEKEEAARKSQLETQTGNKEYWDSVFKESISNLTRGISPELAQLKAYMLSQAEQTKDALMERYNAVMAIISGRNFALSKLMSAKGDNEKAYWQDQYSAWFGAGNAVDTSFLNDVNNQAIIGEANMKKYNDELERTIQLEAKRKDLQTDELTKLYEKQAESQVKQMEIQTKLDSGKIGDEQKSILEANLQAEKDIEAELLKQIQSYGDLQDKAKQAKIIEDARAEALEKVTNAENKQNQNYGKSIYNSEERKFKSIEASMDDITNVNVITQFEEYKKKLQELKDLRDRFANDPNAVNNEGLVQSFHKTALEAENLRKGIKLVINETQKLNNLPDSAILAKKDIMIGSYQIDEVQSKIKEFTSSILDGKLQITGWNATGMEAYAVLDKGRGVLEQVTVALKEGTNELVAYRTGSKEVGTAWQQLKKGMSGPINQFKNALIGGTGIYKFASEIREGINAVKEIDSAMTELKKVTGETDTTYSKFLKNASENSSKIGTTMKEYIESTSDFARLGYNINQANELSKAANIYKNVGDGIDDVATASESIISTMKAFGIEAENAMSIVDKFNEVGNNFAIDSAGIGEALQKSASALAAAGNDLDESIALITAAMKIGCLYRNI